MNEELLERKSKAFKAVPFVSEFMSRGQLRAMVNNIDGEEGEYFANKLIELKDLTDNMPKTYEQDGKGEQAVVYLHYFIGSADWYITERDIEREQVQAFGLSDLGNGLSELGYISISEIARMGVELDLHFEPVTLAEARKLKA